MVNSNYILSQHQHRPWSLPDKPFIYYQEWYNTMFLHFSITPSGVLPFIPKFLELDIFNGKAWVSLVAFTVKRLKPRLLPPFPLLSNFNEVNIRTYVTAEAKPGIYFIDIRADKMLSLKLTKFVTSLPYQQAKINREN